MYNVIIDVFLLVLLREDHIFLIFDLQHVTWTKQNKKVRVKCQNTFKKHQYKTIFFFGHRPVEQ